MAIVLRQAGEAAAAATAGTMIGAAEKRKREEAIAEQRAAEERAEQRAAKRQEQAIAAQLAGEERAQQWELEKMQMRSQQEFAHELRVNQTNLNAEARAKEWEVEKMDIRSRMDFVAEEKERQRKKSLGQARVDAIKTAYDQGKFSKDDPAVKEKLDYFQFMAEAGEEPPTALYSQPTTRTPGFEERQFATLSPEEQQQAMDVKFGFKARPQAKPTTPLEAEASVISMLIPPEERKLNNFMENRLAAREIAKATGLDYDVMIQQELGTAAPSATAGPRNLPVVNSDAAYEALPSGSEFVDEQGKRWRKP